MSSQITWRMVQGTINDHLVRLESSNGIKALFKQPRDQGRFKLVEIANELIVHKLARMISIPVSQTYVDLIEGKIGMVSIILSELNWNHAISQGTNKVLNLDLFKQLFAFDVWIANIDRGNGKKEHVIVIQTELGYSFYAIDHGHTLNGCTQGEIKWQMDNVIDHSKFSLNSLNHISEPEIKSFEDLEPMIKKIEELQDGTIDNIVDETCLLVSRGRSQEEQQALETNCDVIKALLKERRNNLRVWLRDWCIAKAKPLVLLNN